MNVKINNEEFILRYTIESWKKLKEVAKITPSNIQDKLNEDFAGCISQVIYFGLSIDDRKKVTVEQLDSAFGFEIMDVVMPAIMEGMPKAIKGQSEGEEGSSKK